MTQIPVGVGNTASQQRFIQTQQDFLREYSNLLSLLTKTFIRALERPNEQEVRSLEKLPESDPAVVAFEDTLMAARVVFYLGRTAADDFGELLVLSGNGYGVGALKVLRGMYERIVTAAYIAKSPAEARIFVDDDAIKKWTLWRELVKAMPDISSQYSEEQIRGLERRYNEARVKRKLEICPKCRQPKTQEAWTRVTMKDMATRADAGLAELYASCYLQGTFHSHATSYGIGSRLRDTVDGGHTYRDTTEREARMAVLLGHNLILRLLWLQNAYFKLGLDSEIEGALKRFPSIWDTRAQ